MKWSSSSLLLHQRKTSKWANIDKKGKKKDEMNVFQSNHLSVFVSVSCDKSREKNKFAPEVMKDFFFFLVCMWIHTKADRPVYMMKDCFFPTVIFLSEVWIGMLVKGSTVKWSQANGSSMTICSLVKYVCYSNKHQCHWNKKKQKTKQMSQFLNTELNYPKSNCVLNETELLRFIHASVSFSVKETWCATKTDKFCVLCFSAARSTELLKNIHLSVDNWTLHGSKLRLRLMDALWGWEREQWWMCWLFVI